MKNIQDVSKEIPIYPDPVYWPTSRTVKVPIPTIPWSFSDTYLELNTDFEENSPFQEDVISETYQIPDISYFQQPEKLESLINRGS